MTRLQRVSVAVLVAVQALGGGAITLAHARDARVAPPGLEASHDGRCAILHDELRCALCHYAGTRVIPQALSFVPEPRLAPTRFPAAPALAPARSRTRSTAPARAPPSPA